MFADVGFANAFRRAGLFPDPDDDDDDGIIDGVVDTGDAARRRRSILKGVSTVSGGSWFSTQLFYSREFYNRTVNARSGGELERFVEEWMGSYYDISSTAVSIVP